MKGGHAKIMEAVDNFKRENNENLRFEKLVQYFMDPSATAEFQTVCMNFINVIVHSAEDMNFRIHLQHEFTLLGLDEFIEVCTDLCKYFVHYFFLQPLKTCPDSPPVLVTQISAYQQNFFSVADLIEDSQTKAAALATVQEMEKKIQEVCVKSLW